MSKIYFLLIGFMMLGAVFLPAFNIAKAQDDVFAEIQKQAATAREQAGYTAPKEEGFLQEKVGAIIKAALGLLGTVFVVLMVYAGFLWMTAGGNEEDVGKAKKLLGNAVVGLLVILAAYGITRFVIENLVGATTK